MRQDVQQTRVLLAGTVTYNL